MKKEKEILRKQLGLLAEEAENGCTDEMAVSHVTDSMCKIYRELNTLTKSVISWALFLAVFANLLVCFVIQVKKLFRS